MRRQFTQTQPTQLLQTLHQSGQQFLPPAQHPCPVTLHILNKESEQLEGQLNSLHPPVLVRAPPKLFLPVHCPLSPWGLLVLVLPPNAPLVRSGFEASDILLLESFVWVCWGAAVRDGVVEAGLLEMGLQLQEGAHR